MNQIVFDGVSPRSLGDFLKGYGIMAVIGETWPETIFHWDTAGHLISTLERDTSKATATDSIRKVILDWSAVTKDFAQVTKVSCNKPLPCPDHGETGRKAGMRKCAVILQEGGDNPLEMSTRFDAFSSDVAEAAWAVAIPYKPWGTQSSDRADTRSHPWFGAHGQDGRGNYFAQLAKASRAAEKDRGAALEWSLYHCGPATFDQRLESGGAFFPGPMKRYATGIVKWVREADAPVSPWCYLLALRGALLLRGSLRRMRFARSDYPSFPFLFEGASGWEVHLPTWAEAHPRKLGELRLQIAQFQVRLRGEVAAANAAEFRAAVAGRGIAAGFDRFYRFVLEERRPGQQQYLQQAILRGITFVGRQTAADVRLLVAPLAQRRWLNSFKTERQLGKKPKPEDLKKAECRRAIEDAIHAAIDEPRPERFLGILDQIWQANLLLAKQAKDSDTNNPVAPSPPLDASAWERALEPLLRASPEHRIARAIGSILGARGTREGKGEGAADESEGGGASGGPNNQDQPRNKGIGSLVSQLLPLDERRNWSKERGTDIVDWSGTAPLHDFTELLWRRWLHSAGSGLPYLALRRGRTAPLADIARLLRSELDVKEIHRLVPLYALLDWGQQSEAKRLVREEHLSAIPPAYAILRCWLHLAIYPQKDESGERVGTIPRLLATRRAPGASRAVAIALRRLRIRGLPTRDGKERPFGKSVADADVLVHQRQAELLPLAALIPLSTHDVLTLADQLRVRSPDRQLEETAT